MMSHSRMILVDPALNTPTKVKVVHKGRPNEITVVHMTEITGTMEDVVQSIIWIEKIYKGEVLIETEGVGLAVLQRYKALKVNA
jgi:hypothetical protein